MKQLWLWNSNDCEKPEDPKTKWVPFITWVTVRTVAAQSIVFKFAVWKGQLLIIIIKKKKKVLSIFQGRVECWCPLEITLTSFATRLFVKFSMESYKISFLCLFLSLFSAWAKERFLQMELCWPQQATTVLSNSGRSILRGKMSQGNWRVRKWRILEQRTVFSLWELSCYRITCNGHSQGIIKIEGEYL